MSDREPWKRVPMLNCGGNKYLPDEFYELPGYFMIELRQMAYLLSSGEKIDADQRRNMAQRIQAVMDSWTFLAKDWGKQ